MAFGNIYENKRVLITGHTGFKGSWLTNWLLDLGAEVFGLSDIIYPSPSLFEVIGLENKVENRFIDIRELKKIIEEIKHIKPDYIFHLAAQPIVSISYKNPVDTFTTNVVGTLNILEALRISNHNCTAIIITSDKCYDNVEWIWGYKENDAIGGKDIYSGSKGAAELVFNSYFHSFFKKDSSNVRVASVRAGNVIGGGDWAKDRLIPDCMRAWSRKEVVEIRSPNATRPWQHVLEPLSGYLQLGKILSNDLSLNGESFNFGPSDLTSYTVEKVLKDLSDFWNFKTLDEAYEIIEKKEFHEAGLLKLNCDKANYYLKWHPTLNYNELIEFTSKWYYLYYNEKKNMYQH